MCVEGANFGCVACSRGVLIGGKGPNAALYLWLRIHIVVYPLCPMCVTSVDSESGRVGSPSKQTHVSTEIDENVPLINLTPPVHMHMRVTCVCLCVSSIEAA